MLAPFCLWWLSFAVPFALHPAEPADDPIARAIRLTAAEKIRKAELETIVGHGLEEFLKVGAALAELRNKRLYRTESLTFEQYVQTKFGLHRARVDALIRSSCVARDLIEAGAHFPAGTNEATVRPLCALPDDDDLRAATWEFVQVMAPERPSQPIVSRICRVIKNALDGIDEDDSEEVTESKRAGFTCGPRHDPLSPAREFPFVRPIERLAAWKGFSVEIIVSSVKPPSAATVYHACDVLANRCREVKERLAANFPELASHA